MVHDSQSVGEPKFKRPSSGPSRDDQNAALPQAPPLSYTPPEGSCLPRRQYSFEVIKEGVMLEPEILPGDKEFLVAEAYLFDLGSAHGTFINKRRLAPRSLTKLEVGDQVRFGASTRLWIFQTSDNEYLEEKEHEKDRQLQEYISRKARPGDATGPRESRQALESGCASVQLKHPHQEVTWGFGEDATENAGILGRVDMDIDNGWQPRENAFYRKNPDRGYDATFEYDEEHIMRVGRVFVARIQVPLVDSAGAPLHGVGRGPKKRCGLFQATHQAQSAKRKGVSGYYDSDDEEDSYYDRSNAGKASKAQKKAKPVTETYESLIEKLALIEKKMAELEAKIGDVGRTGAPSTGDDEDDELDAYMNSLRDKETALKERQLKSELLTTQKEKERLEKLIRIAAPQGAVMEPKGPTKVTEMESKEGAAKLMPQISPRLPRQQGSTVVVRDGSAGEVLLSEGHAPTIAAEPTKDVQTKPAGRRRMQGPTLPQSMEDLKPKAEDKMLEEYDADESWVPPSEQTGDGRTSLNDKLGY
ncbi:hypothetical protein EV182_002043 [Spiromyces aspiralis]|uniref:Uncharacterized protein n=1 Tax=Spiromyces aspiralis TaxID=68401 RepID=A0ACC1HYF6_9FUNG|nr:hypothetical protein EV182_002043 [Spiromyces aspiralis]